ncbi:MAG: cobalamin-binding protein [Pseudomonadota bacterium]
MTHTRGPERIVCLTEETTETLYLLGEQARIVGISGFTVRPPQARKEKPRVAAFTSAKIDRILALKPDLVLGFSDLQADIAAELIRAGVAVHVFNQRSVAGIFDMIATLGALIHRSDAATKLMTDIDCSMQRIRQRAKRLDRRPVVYFEEWDDPLISGIQWVSELIEWAGGEDAFADRARNPGAKDRIIAQPDQVITRNPDIIIGSWCGKKFRPERVAERPGWDRIAAVQHDQLYEIKSCDILQPGPAALTDGLEQIASVIDRWARSNDRAVACRRSRMASV